MSRVPVVESGKERIWRLREFQDRYHPTGPQHSAHFFETLAVIGQVAESERHRDQVEGPIARRNFKRVGFEYAGPEAAPRDLLRRRREHGMAEIAAPHSAAAIGFESEHQVAGAAAEI